MPKRSIGKTLQCIARQKEVMLICQATGQIVYVQGCSSVFQCSHHDLFLKNFFELMAPDSRQQLIAQSQNNPLQYLRSQIVIEVCPSIISHAEFEGDFIVRKNKRSNKGYERKKIKVKCFQSFATFALELDSEPEIEIFQENYKSEQHFEREVFVVVCSSEAETRRKKKNEITEDSPVGLYEFEDSSLERIKISSDIFETPNKSREMEEEFQMERYQKEEKFLNFKKKYN